MDMPPPSDYEIGHLLYPLLPEPPCLMLISGESSAGKTALSYNLAHRVAEGMPFLGSEVEQPLRVLYVDLDNPDTVHRMLVEKIGRSDNVSFVRSLPGTLDTEQGRSVFFETCHEHAADVLVIDSLPVVWPVRDENDNAIADRQMVLLKELT